MADQSPLFNASQRTTTGIVRTATCAAPYPGLAMTLRPIAPRLAQQLVAVPRLPPRRRRREPLLVAQVYREVMVEVGPLVLRVERHRRPRAQGPLPIMSIRGW